MITAVDTSVLLDVFGADRQFGPASRDAIRTCLSQGALIACDIVWAEVAGAFSSGERARNALGTLGVTFEPLAAGDALAAGQSWRDYRRAGGRRERVIADFLIAAHAAGHADQLLTRDRGFYRRYFEGLLIIDPGLRPGGGRRPIG